MSRDLGERAELLAALVGEFRELSAATVMFHQAVADRLGMNITDHKCADILSRTGPTTAGELARQSETLRHDVDNFLATVRAA